MGYFPPVSITNEILRNGSTGSSSDGNVKSRGQDRDEHDEEGGNSSPVSAFQGGCVSTGTTTPSTRELVHFIRFSVRLRRFITAISLHYGDFSVFMYV